MSTLKSSKKPFDISKWEVWDAWIKVKGNKGAPGVDELSLAEFEADLEDNLYMIWNRMSSGTYFPPPVKGVEAEKQHGGGTRMLGVPTVGDRVAQTVVAAHLQQRLEPVFHPDSFGYRPGRSQLDAVETCRRRCWEYDWVIDLDVQKFFDSVPWELIVKAVKAHTDARWVVLYVERWLAAPIHMPDGTVQPRDRGTPRGRRSHPCSRTCSCITRSIAGCRRTFRRSRLSATPTMRWCTAPARRRPARCSRRCMSAWPKSG